MKRLDASINGSIEDNLEVESKVSKRSSSSISAQQLDTSMVYFNILHKVSCVLLYVFVQYAKYRNKDKIQ